MSTPRATIDANVWVAAFEKRDRLYDDSFALLRKLAHEETELHAPAFLLLEVSCAVSRRSGNADAGRAAAHRLSAHPLLTLHPVDEQLLMLAQRIGTAHSLRAADALYVATAHLFDAPLITWDSELITRAGAVSAANWL